MLKKLYGYARVSTKEQHEDRQIIQLKEEGILDKNIFVDKCSGKNFDRPEYKKLLKKLTKGDVLYITSIDRLGRNYDELISQWDIITHKKNVDIVVIDMPILDTRTVKGLTARFLNDLVFYILCYVADTERKTIKKRQAEGIAAAKQKGIRFGRPCKDIPANFIIVKTMWQKGEISAREAARRLELAPKTFKTMVMSFTIND